MISVQAVVHAHPPYATLFSFAGELVPVDAEGSYYFKRVRVVSPQNPIASNETAELVSEELKESMIILVKGPRQAEKHSNRRRSICII